MKKKTLAIQMRIMVDQQTDLMGDRLVEYYRNKNGIASMAGIIRMLIRREYNRLLDGGKISPIEEPVTERD